MKKVKLYLLLDNLSKSEAEDQMVVQELMSSYQIPQHTAVKMVKDCGEMFKVAVMQRNNK